MIGPDQQRQGLFAQSFDVQPRVFENIINDESYVQLPLFKLWNQVPGSTCSESKVDFRER